MDIDMLPPVPADEPPGVHLGSAGTGTPLAGSEQTLMRAPGTLEGQAVPVVAVRGPVPPPRPPPLLPVGAVPPPRPPSEPYPGLQHLDAHTPPVRVFTWLHR